MLHRRCREEHAHVRTRKYCTCRSHSLPHPLPDTRTRTLHTHDDRRHAVRARGIFVHRIYEREFRGKDKQPFECLPCRDNFLATDVTMESGVRRLSRSLPFNTSSTPFRSGNSMSLSKDSRFSRTAHFPPDTSLLFVVRKKLVRRLSCARVDPTRELLGHRYLSVTLSISLSLQNRWLKCLLNR